MMPEKILYTDEYDVTITESFFQVKKTMYQLKGIVHHDFLVVHPYRIPSLLMMLIGALTIMMGTFNWIPKNLMRSFRILSFPISENVAAIAVGAGLLAAGAVILSVAKEHYAIRLSTAEGAKNVLVHKRKEYVARILDALNRASLNLVSQTERKVGSRTFEVGSR
jgi:hypothetical protein